MVNTEKTQKKRAPRFMASKRAATKSTTKAIVGKGKNKKDNIWSKLLRTPKPIIIGLWLIAFGAIGTKMLFFSGATAFQYVGTHPQAINQPETSAGRQLLSLAAWNGKIYAGYGDWNKNTGPVYLTPFDPATNTFASTAEHIADTETIEIFKTIGDKLYAMHVDPKSHWGAAYSLGDVSSGSLVWKNMAKPTMTHVFGITSGISPSELFIAGTLDNGSGAAEEAMVFRSTDGGNTWNESLRIPNRGGFNRMMFVGKLGDKVYAQNLSTADYSTVATQPEKNAWVFNGSSWSKVTPINSYQPHNSGEFAGKLIAQSSPAGGSLLGYDGRTTTTLRSNVRDYKVHSDNYLYALTYNNNDLSVMRTKDFVTWEQIAAVPNNSRSLAVLGNTIYVGTTESQLYKAEINPLITDATPPAASLIAPTAPLTVTTSNEFAVNATDAASIDKVEFYVGSTLIGISAHPSKATQTGCMSIGTSTSCSTSTSSYPGSYTVRWNGSGVPAGSYPLKAIAYDIYGNSRETSNVLATVPEGLYPPDTQSPTITISSPSTTQRIRKSVQIIANASDNDQVVYMEIQLDGNSIANGVSGSISKSVLVSRGSHNVVVIAKDKAGNTAQTDRSFISR